jgi:hypothetical protein
MKLLTGWVVSAGLVFTAVAANAQGLARYEVGDSPYVRASDIDGPYAAMPPEAPLPRYHPGHGPTLLPATEVYTVLRESGFSPLGIPRRRGLVYTISVIDRAGDDGRLLIDARTGRIIRFIRASRIGDTFDDDLTTIYGPAGPLPPPPASAMRAPTRPPAAAPRVATRTPSVPIPRASPQHAATPKPLAAKPVPAPAPAPAQQSAVVQAKPAEAQAVPPQAAAPAVAAPPPAAVAPQPTQEMPNVQGLE